MGTPVQMVKSLVKSAFHQNLQRSQKKPQRVVSFAAIIFNNILLIRHANAEKRQKIQNPGPAVGSGNSDLLTSSFELNWPFSFGGILEFTYGVCMVNGFRCYTSILTLESMKVQKPFRRANLSLGFYRASISNLFMVVTSYF